MGLWTMTYFYAIIPFFLVFFNLAVLWWHFSKKVGDRAKRLPLQIIASLIIVLEIIKQVTSIIKGYDLYHLPFHYCSLFLYLLPLHAFAPAKIKKFVDAVTYACCASLLLFFLIMPSVIYPEEHIIGWLDNYFNFHTLVFHHLVVLYFFLALSTRSFKLSPKHDLGFVAIFLSSYVVVGTVLSYALKVNFHNLRTCNLGACEEIRVMLNEAMGWFGQAVYVFALFILTTLFAYLAYFLVYLVYRLITKEKAS